MNRSEVRLMVYRQIRLQHPEYTEAQMQRAVDEVVDMIIQVDEAGGYQA